ncbi:SIS domain-containing protein [Pseudomarimonas arenosa]|uniref:SIS domain-containing protein n=1 Tax=Pseudomarimonas arenosa TaxID=2774145 RepID=A0AAW3ZHY5_9GAMM|nr:SIS domain-containing protein [Pseudomarimonas arenosa]MBD8524859.1 SIS domain-containing protein [Pseudomarimonas arenosa]
MIEAARATLLFSEAASAASVISTQFQHNRLAVADLAAELRARPPRAVVTCARGSSDHAATYAKYLIETRLGLITASAAPSVSSVYGRPQDLRDCLFIAISQSGQSPDLIAAAIAARQAGARVLAMVNVEDSPLAAAADHVLALCAGAERSVAASKSFIAALFATLHLVSEWHQDEALRYAVAGAEDALSKAWELDWGAAEALLIEASHLYVIGRGLGLAIAQEAALKGKETSGLHAEAFSAAEVRHGPQALLGQHFPALLLAQDDSTRAGSEQLARELLERGVPLVLAGVQLEGAINLPSLAADPALQPLLLIQSYYRLINSVSLARGHDPDRPPHLRKVTETH